MITYISRIFSWPLVILPLLLCSISVVVAGSNIVAVSSIFVKLYVISNSGEVIICRSSMGGAINPNKGRNS